MNNGIYLKNRGVRAFQATLTIIFVLMCVCVIVPFALTLVSSFSSELSIMQKGYSFFPMEWSTDAYKYVFRDNSILVAYWVTIRVTVFGTFFSVMFCSLAGYVLSRKQVKYRNFISMFFYLPTILNPGSVAWYYNVKYVFNMDNTFWVLVFPGMINVFNIFMIRNYYKTISVSLEESAQIDGATPFQIFRKIMFPLALPITATVVLWVSLGYWNDWYAASWFIDVNHKDLYPLQYYLYKLWATFNSGTNSDLAPEQTVYLATMFITIGPIVLVYPFVQKYFIKGIMVGAVKG